MKVNTSTRKRLVSLALAVVMLMALIVSVLPMQASAFVDPKEQEVVLYANNPNCEVSSKFARLDFQGFAGEKPNHYAQYNIVLSEKEFEVSGNTIVKNFNTKPDGSGKSYPVGNTKLDRDVDTLYAQWTTGFEGKEVKLHNGSEVRTVKTDKYGGANLPNNVFTKPGSRIVAWTAEPNFEGHRFYTEKTPGVETYETLRKDYITGSAGIFTDLYVYWMDKKEVTYKDNSGNVLFTELIESAPENVTWNPLLNFEKASNKVTVGHSTKPNGGGDWYVPYFEYEYTHQTYIDIPDVLYVQQIDIPKSDYLICFPMSDSPADVNGLARKYTVVNFSGGAVPSATAFDDNNKVEYWSDMYFDMYSSKGYRLYGNKTPFTYCTTLQKNAGGSRPQMGAILYGRTQLYTEAVGPSFYGESSDDKYYEVTTSRGPDGSKHTETVKTYGPTMNLTVNPDGSATGTSKWDGRLEAETEVTSDGDITVEVFDHPFPGYDISREVTLPVMKQGFVPSFIGEDGEEEIIKLSVAKTHAYAFKVKDNGVVTISDRSKSFSDVKDNAWYKGDVDFVSARELFQGTDEGVYSPEEKLSRGMFIAVLWRLSGEPEAEIREYKDIADDAYYLEAASWADEYNISVGSENGYFYPNRDITREEIATMMYNIGEGRNTNGNADKFSDAYKVSSWAKEAMDWAVGRMIIQGSDGYILPQGKATRAEAAAMVQRFTKTLLKF